MIGDKLSIKQLLIGFSLTGALLVLTVGGVGFWGAANIESGLANVADTQSVLRRHLDGDMMHEAIRGNVLAGMLAAKEGRAEQEKEISRELAESIATMKKAMEENGKAQVGEEVKRQVAAVTPLVDSYATHAQAAVAAAFHNSHAAAQQLAEVEKDFSALETELGRLSDMIEGMNSKTKDAAAQTASYAKTVIAGLGTLALGLLFAIAAYVVRSVTVPLSHLAQIATRIEQSGDLSLRAEAHGDNEISRTVHAFNSLMDATQHIVREVHCNVEEVTTAVSSLVSAGEELETASSAQSESAATIAAAMEEVSSSIHQVAENAKTTEDLSEEARANSEHGNQIVNDAVAEIGRISDSVNEAAKQIGILNQRSNEISGIVKVIKDIADQTNLLALNAAIEAARAGEAGRGFAVVADEVRKLAERTGGATIEITTLISAIQTETGNAVTGMNLSSKHAERGLQLAGEAGEALAHISSSARNTAARVKETAHAAEEQSTAVQDIVATVERMAQMAEKNSQAMSSTSTVARNLEHLAANLKTAAGRFKH